jgi:two-component system, chemotaxis family, chemotaxis protein CheY
MEKKKIKILVVDDNIDIRTVYAEVFRKDGFDVTEADDGLDGLDKATKDIPDIIFTGIVMPRMDGFDLMTSLKKNVATKDIPVIISSHMGREEDQKKAMELGARDFIVKSMNTPKEIVEKIRAMFSVDLYKLRVVENELDAERLATTMRFGKGMKCPNCGEGLIISLELVNPDDKNFKAEVVCPKCGRIMK